MSINISLIGAGIMSATLGVMLKKLMPNAKIHIFERMDNVAVESSDAWNNAGTGHSGFCELNYTPINENGEVDVTKALKIAEDFEISKQFWSYLTTLKGFPTEGAFINDIPHMSFVMGEKNVSFLKKRFEAMKEHVFFEDMAFTEDLKLIEKWIPLMMENRKFDDPIAVTKIDRGTDVNFGALTRGMINFLKKSEGVDLHLGHQVNDIDQQPDGKWKIEVEDLDTDEEKVFFSDFVFIGAGGGSLSLLDESGIPEGKGYGGFPVSGQWLRCTNQAVVDRHAAKVYGKAAKGNPPMSVPHLDTRMLDGKKSLLFGPYAGFSSKFLKNGSYSDLPLSIEMHNIWPMISAGYHNIELTKYLIDQVTDSFEDKFEFLQTYYPDAKIEDWELAIAGQRVQIIKKDKEDGGVLKFGTEVVSAQDGSLAALLGASPGASTSVAIMLEVLKTCFSDLMKSEQWQKSIKEMIPTYGISLKNNSELCRATRERTTRALKLEPDTMKQ